jgi:glutamate synthase (NADPH) small chain
MSHKSPTELQAQAQALLASISQETLSSKQRLKIPPQLPPEQDPLSRAHNLQEVTHAYSHEQAMVEAMRCIQCKKKPCIDGCPVRIDIPAFILEITQGRFQEAVDIIKQTSLLPAICGRVCPQETQCQEKCTLAKSLKDVNKAVAIGRLERFVADWEREQGKNKTPQVKSSTGKRVAIVGSGPAGLVVAADVRRQGHAVTIFEAFHLLGGVMRYGIPEFRLPNTVIDQEISTLLEMGVQFKTNFVIGLTRKLTDLIALDGFDAVFIGTGAGLPLFMGIEGEDLVGVFSANEYLTRANLMRAYERNKSDTPIYSSRKVAVFGGGNVAMDAARMALRLGAAEVSVIYRRTEREMPARVEEVAHAKEEGIRFNFLQNAKRLLGDQQGRVRAMECLRYKLGEPDESGRRRPLAIPGSEFIQEIDTALIAIGNGSNPLIARTNPDLKVNKWGNVIVGENGETSLERIYAGGDISQGAATVILAMGDGRKAAAAINAQLASRAIP